MKTTSLQMPQKVRVPIRDQVLPFLGRGWRRLATGMICSSVMIDFDRRWTIEKVMVKSQALQRTK